MNKLAVEIGNTFFNGPHFLTQLTGLGQLVTLLLRNAIILAGIIFIFLLIFGGFSIIVGAGQNNPQRVAQGKQAATAAVIGFLVVFATYWIAQIVQILTGVKFI